MPSFPETVGGWLLDLLGFVGLALGGAQAAATAKLNEMQNDSWHLDPIRRHTPSALAEMVVKGVITQDEGADEATRSGMRPDRFAALVMATGNPPGFGELLTMWRRGIINQGDVTTGIKQGYIKTEWTPFMERLRYDPLTPAEAVQAAVQNHLDVEQAAGVADSQGVNRADFDVMYATAGNPPGPMEVLNLWVRGYIDEATVDQALRESRLKNKYIDPLKKLAIRKIPMRTITTLVGHGAFTDDQGVAHLHELGYTDEDARAIILSSHHTTTTAAKHLSVAQIRDAYVERAISRDQAVADLKSAGYPDDVAGQLLDLADVHITTALRRASINRVHTAFVAHKIDRGAASMDLDSLQVPAGQRDAMLELWQLEQDTNVAVLTTAQILKADKEGVISPDEAHARLMRHGYADRDATILQILYGSYPLPNP